MSSRKNQLKALGFALAVTLGATGGFSVPAHADNDYGHGYSHHNDNVNNDNNHHGGYNDRHSDSNRKDHDSDRIIIDDNDRQSINDYMRNHHHHHNHCPPGLAKKNNGCLPPGQARRYEVGQRLSTRVTYVVVPYSLRRHLRPIQPGYQYVRVDDDVLLMSKNDRIIVDAVALLSDLAR